MNEVQDSAADPRIYMAAERTFLAWIRTGIAFMGFGFVVARFGLFLREIAVSNNVAAAHSPRSRL
jgi:putative membrane protein